MLVELSWVELQ